MEQIRSASWPSGRARDGGIDRVPVPAVSGALWLCGKHLVGPDPEAALAKVGATGIVCLTERHELADRYPAYVDWLAGAGAERSRWHPIPDLHAPPLTAATELLSALADDLANGQHLIMHCAAGIGRAGTMAVGLLMVLGLDRDQALEVVAAARPMAGPEVGAQRDLVDALAVALGRT